jgi:signal recognition particle subunit SRP54
MLLDKANKSIYFVSLSIINVTGPSFVNSTPIIAPNIPVTLGITFRRSRLYEPRVLITRMIDHQINQDFHSTGMSLLQKMIKIFHDEMVHLLGGGSATPLDLSKPSTILIVGLNGAGKTTSAAKLALHLKKTGRLPALVACDLERPAAIDQLAKLGAASGIPVFTPPADEFSLVRVARSAKDWLARQNTNIAIYDTAGRQEVNSELMAQIVELRDFLRPKEILLVADAATGQQAVGVAEAFHKALGITGVILTKLDGDARGGAALSMREVTGCPIKFIGTGERPDAFEAFHPDRMAGRILGMGDVVSLVEKAAAQIDLADAGRMEERLRKAEFDFNDFLDQIRMLRNLGPLENVLGMLPGMGKVSNSSLDERQVRRQEAMVLSMTPEERRKPGMLNARRRQRIARGSGTSVAEVNGLLQRLNQMKKMLKNTGKLRKLMASARGPQVPGFPGGFKGFR